MNSNWSNNPETPNLGQIRWFLEPCELEIWCMTLKINRAPLLCYLKLYTSFHSHRWIQPAVTNLSIVSNLSIPCTPDGVAPVLFFLFKSIMLMFAPSYLMFKTIAEHTADIASEYKLTHRKVCEFSCGISRHHDTHSNFKNYSSTMVYWIYSITFPLWIVSGGAISVRCAAIFT